MYILYLEEISDRHEGTIMFVWQAVKVLLIICLQLHQNRLHKKSTDKRQEKGTISKKHLWYLIMCFNYSIVYPQKNEEKSQELITTINKHFVPLWQL